MSRLRLESPRRLRRLVGCALLLSPLLALTACTPQVVRQIERALLEVLAVMLLFMAAAVCAGLVYFAIVLAGAITAAVNFSAPTPVSVRRGWIAAGLNLSLAAPFLGLVGFAIYAMVKARDFEPGPFFLLVVGALFPLALGVINLVLCRRSKGT